MVDISVKKIIDLLGLKPLPEEGGYYSETYRAVEIVEQLPVRFEGVRNFSTAIFYLLTPEHFSKLHRVKSDEIFHFYFGSAVEIFCISDDGKAETQILGTDIINNQSPQIIVPQNTWQGSRLVEGGKFALLGCTVSPGFEFADYQHGSRKDLTTQYPHLAEQIKKYT